ncbi:hypothetical protein M595_4204 [Lyngbya aestuarii BL J]|uniref:Uncharacterized protein n=1 Tax=Lyngbya aestuarii BL J TaxID=1348334 RepID=U7QDB4_9CYAN|nr:hypothetical protein [Lyngbya aestuarii]ERT05833.1 hypothetical protein M595_4204 [Lyngbya aestuarii BL J]
MKPTTIFALASLFFLGITSQVQAANHQSTAFLELENQKYMMSAQLKNHGSSDPSRGSGRRFVENPTANSGDNFIFLHRGSGR